MFTCSKAYEAVRFLTCVSPITGERLSKIRRIGKQKIAVSVCWELGSDFSLLPWCQKVVKVCLLVCYDFKIKDFVGILIKHS